MSLVINGRFLSQAVTGVQRYAGELVRAIDASCLDYKTSRSILMLAPAAHKQRLEFKLEHLPLHREGRFTGHIWEQLELPRYSRGKLLLNLCNTGPLACANQVTVIHDAAVFAAPSGYSRPFLAWYRFLLPRLCRRARLIVTVSQFSKRELIRWCGADPERVKVVYNGSDHLDRVTGSPGTLDKFGLNGRSFILGVGSLHPNKNFGLFARLAARFAARGVEFVVAGGGNERVFARAGLGGPGVRFLGYVSDGELKTLYENAICLVFPSRYEGFGIPPMEAMRCGCPVVAARAASLPEICGEAALFADPDSPVEFGRQVAKLLTSATLAGELREAGRLRAAGFSWNVGARRLLDLLPD